MIRGAHRPSFRIQTAPFARCWYHLVKNKIQPSRRAKHVFFKRCQSLDSCVSCLSSWFVWKDKKIKRIFHNLPEVHPQNLRYPNCAECKEYIFFPNIPPLGIGGPFFHFFGASWEVHRKSYVSPGMVSSKAYGHGSFSLWFRLASFCQRL